MNHLKQCKLFAAGLAAVALTLIQASPAKADHAINGNFDNTGALTGVYHQARDSFALWTTDGTGPGGVDKCPTPGDWGHCWVYWQMEPNRGQLYAALRVEPVVDTHYHLSFEDESLDCLALTDPDGGGYGFGRRNSSGTCVAADWVHEPRYAAAHDIGEWYDVYIQAWDYYAGPQQDRFFDLTSFNVKADPVNLWVLWSDWNWYYLSNLGPGAVGLQGWADGIFEAQIGSDTGYSAIDDVSIGKVYL